MWMFLSVFFLGIFPWVFLIGARKIIKGKVSRGSFYFFIAMTLLLLSFFFYLLGLEDRVKYIELKNTPSYVRHISDVLSLFAFFLIPISLVGLFLSVFWFFRGEYSAGDGKDYSLYIYSLLLFIFLIALLSFNLNYSSGFSAEGLFSPIHSPYR